MSTVSIFWFRRDLRLNDNAGLYHALQSSKSVLPLFIFDTDILDELENKSDRRVEFIYQNITDLHQHLKKLGNSILIEYGEVESIFRNIIKKYKVESVYTNHDYEPYAIERDEKIRKLLEKEKISFYTFKDQVIFEKQEIISDSGTAYKVYTAYKNKWLAKLAQRDIEIFDCKKLYKNFYQTSPLSFPSLESMGFKKNLNDFPHSIIKEEKIMVYDKERDFPHMMSTSLLGLHLRFGTISIRETVRKAKELNAVWLSELIWREFFMQLLFNFPYVVEKPFNQRFSNMAWRHDEDDFIKWTEGKTGYPLVDAGMRQLNATGFMHNRVRMVTASFLSKHLLIDWRWGEVYFAKHLLDYELSSNNGNWQWVAGTGADAQPFFRIFNPETQQKKFDPQFEYIRTWVPEYGSSDYPKPMVDHKAAVERAKKAFNNLG